MWRVSREPRVVGLTPRSLTWLSNVSLQLTGACMREVVVAAALVLHVSHLHLPGQHVARS